MNRDDEGPSVAFAIDLPTRFRAPTMRELASMHGPDILIIALAGAIMGTVLGQILLVVSNGG